MKHLLPFFVLTLMLSTQAVGQETYEILHINNAESITIGNRPKKAGDTFKSTDQIAFTSDRQSFKAQKKGTSKAYFFNKKAMEAKKSKTLKDYFANDYNKTKGSTRGLSGNAPAVMQGKYDAVKYPEKRIALVIGNGNYQELDILPNAINDARDVSDRLKQLGFDVVTLYDGDINDMQTTVNSFFQLAQGYQVALIYFAGHGIRYEGKDYLLSIDREGLGIKDECSLEYLIDESEKWKNDGKIMIFVIDACRNRKGFSDDDRVPSAKRGTAILQSTSSGEEAMDANAGSGNSPFATAFINGIGSSENNIVEEFEDISKEVTRKTSYRQEPMISRNGVYNFQFCKGNNNTTTNTFSSNHQGNIVAQLAVFTQKGKELYDKKNYEEAFQQFKIAAEGGDIEGQFRLGYCYTKGLGINQSDSNALIWFSTSAKQGYAEAQLMLGASYYFASSFSGKPQPREAAENVENIGLEYLHSQPTLYSSIPYTTINYQSDSIAAYWLRKAAEKGNSFAQNLLGALYQEGHGVKQSDEEAAKWFRKSADQGKPVGQINLGRCYMLGKGVEKSEITGAQLYKKAAEQNYHFAQYLIGICYKYGNGVKKSISKAKKWLQLAAEQGNSLAKYELEGM